MKKHFITGSLTLAAAALSAATLDIVPAEFKIYKVGELVTFKVTAKCDKGKNKSPFDRAFDGSACCKCLGSIASLLRFLGLETIGRELCRRRFFVSPMYSSFR